MGGGGKTKKTFEEVKADLMNDLTANARAVLKRDYNVDDKTSNLESLLKQIAFKRFESVYKYAFSEDSTKVHPPNNLGDVRVSAQLCSIEPPIGSQVQDYLDAGVFSKLDLPDWMEKTAKNDLGYVARTVVSRDTQKQWLYQEYKRTYDARKEDQDTFVCNSTIVYCNGSLLEDGTRAQVGVILFAGVYYKTTSETKATRDRIQASAYEGAAKLQGATTPTTDEGLKSVLDAFAKTRFSDNFKWDYNTNPPDSLRSEGVDSAYMVANSSLYYVPDTDTDKLQGYIEDQFYAGLGIPLPSVKNQAMADTFKQYRSILDNASTESWNQTRIDKTYIPADPTLNPIRQAAVIFSWYDHKTTDTQVSISVKYIYIMTMFYEVLNADQLIARELWKKLCNNLRRHIEGDDGSGDIADPIKLKEFMKDYAVQEWKKAFAFDYKGDDSTPKTLKPGGRVSSYEELLQLKDYPATEQEVSDWMDAEVFKRDDRKFPPWAMGPIYDDVVNHMMRYGSDQVQKDNNWWYTADFKKEYFDETGKNQDLQQFNFYVYALGDMVLNRPGSDGGEGVRIKRMMVYWIGLFISFQDEPW